MSRPLSSLVAPCRPLSSLVVPCRRGHCSSRRGATICSTAVATSWAPSGFRSAKEMEASSLLKDKDAADNGSRAFWMNLRPCWMRRTSLSLSSRLPHPVSSTSRSPRNLICRRRLRMTLALATPATAAATRATGQAAAAAAAAAAPSISAPAATLIPTNDVSHGALRVA